MSDTFLFLLANSPLAHQLLLIVAGWLSFWGILLIRLVPAGPHRPHRDCPRCALRTAMCAEQGHGL